MSWKKHFQVAPVTKMKAGGSPSSGYEDRSGAGSSTGSKYSSWLPEVYSGQPNRLERYSQYDQMDLDSEIHSALNTIAEFCTQIDDNEDLPFEIVYHEEPTETESQILETALRQWIKLNDFRRRLWGNVRKTLKYGDQFFIRDPETYELMWVDHTKVQSIIADEASGKKPVQYLIRDLDLNIVAKTATAMRKDGASAAFNTGFPGTMSGGVEGVTGSTMLATTPTYQSRFGSGAHGDQVVAVDAEHVVHLSLSDGQDGNWPFGNSILESVFKTYKQKEMLEDSLIIYRVQRAPERRVFYVDVGNMPAHKAMAYVERIKNEIHQRRIPNRTGGGASVLDAAYNPLCLSLDTKIPLLDGRILMLSDLIEEYNSGKENWVYSCNPETGAIVPGPITWAGVTRKDAQVVRLTLDNGQTLTVTPDHKIPVLGKGFVEAKDLTPNDSLISYETKDIGDEYIYDHSLGRFEPIKTIIANFFKTRSKHQEFTFLEENIGKEKTVIHHRDFCYSNNDPRNLQWMNKEDYYEFTKHNWSIGNYGGTSGKTNGSKVEYLPTVQTVDTKIIKIEWLDETIDTGTITVDGKEVWHNYHTFATEAGIFVKNSIIEDYFFAQCLNPNTNIQLLDGRTITLEQVISEYEEGKVNWVYSLNLKTHEMEPAKITWGGITRKNAQQVRVHLDNGKYIDATPDHRFILRDGSEIEAQYLTSGVSLMPLYLHDAKTDKIQHAKKYTRYTCNATGKKKWVHTNVCPKKGNHTVIHHIDFNSRNNSPGNLIEMDFDDHKKLHREAGTYALSTMWKTEEGANKIKAGMRRLYDNADDVFLQKMAVRNSKNGSNTWNGSDGTIRAKINLDLQHKLVPEAKKLRVTDEMFSVMKDAFITYGNVSKRKFCKEVLRNNAEFMSVYASANSDRKRDNGRALDCFDERTLDRLLKHGGYESWGNFKRTFANNHKVVSIEWLEERSDTCDITVEGPSMSHVFAVAAGIYVHNSAEGRGSKVETLPGGDNLGEIDDLKYFNNKLFRGLGVPSSYLPTGPDDGTAQYSDGRVGTAYIQEWRFSKYCQRLQNIIAPTFDYEFKLFLKKRGVVIAPTSYDLMFHEPQNFGDFKRMEIDSQRLSLYSQIRDISWISKRFGLMRYLGWTEEDILENERQYVTENPTKFKKGNTASDEEDGGLRDVGVGGGGGGGGFDLGGGDMDLGGDEGDLGGDGEGGTESPISGGEGGDSGPDLTL